MALTSQYRVAENGSAKPKNTRLPQAVSAEPQQQRTSAKPNGHLFFDTILAGFTFT